MHVLSTILPSLGLFAHLSAAWYTLKDDYGTTDSFFDKFNFYDVRWPISYRKANHTDAAML